MERMEEKPAQPMPTTESPAVPSRSELLQRRIAIASTILLAVTALATAWSSYQAARWSRVYTGKNVEVGKLRLEATRASMTASQMQGIDLGLFTNWLNAYAAGKAELETFYRERFRDEFKPAFEAWLKSRPLTNPNAAPSPFHLPEYRLALNDKATQLDEEATRTYQDVQAAVQRSDDYVRNDVILATVLFFVAIGQQVKWLPPQVAMLVVAAILCLVGLYNIVTYDVA